MRGSVDFVVKWLLLAAEWQPLMWSEMGSDMCNKHQDLVTSEAIKTPSDETLLKFTLRRTL